MLTTNQDRLADVLRNFTRPSSGGEMLLMVDCSGSVFGSQYGTECNALKQDIRPSTTHVIYFDHDICGYEAFGPDEELVLRPHSGGGTAFSPAFKYALEKGIEPECCVVLTDLYCDDFGPAPDYPVLWVTTGSNYAPWGDIVEMKGL